VGEVSSAVDAIIAGVAALQGASIGELSHREIVAELSRLTTVAWTLPSVEHRLLNRLVGETEPHALGARSWPDVVATALRVSTADARRRVKDARHLGPRQAMSGEALAPLWEATAAAQAEGRIGPEHVAVIRAFHKKLPSWVDVGTRAQSDATLAREARGLWPEELGKAADRLLAMIDQDGPPPSEEERARKRSFILGRQQADGTTPFSGHFTPEARAVIEPLLAKHGAPGMCHPEDETPCVDGEPDPLQRGSDTRSQAQRNHDALVAVGRSALASGELGQHNGLPVTVIVSTTLQELESGAGVAVTGGGSLLPMADLIRMAAHAHHYLYIYDQHTSESLYLGRTKRLASPGQRIVLHSRYRGCTRPGCTASGYHSQVHHAVADWTNDGHTDIDDLTLACGPDNRLIEKTGWSTTVHNGKTQWHPPPELDTGQARVNNYHHPHRYLLPEDDKDP
jgi:hypothetical protein